VRVGICLNFDCLQKSGNVLEMPWSDRARRSFSVNRAKKGNASWKGTRSPSELWRDRNPGIGFSSAHRTCHRLTSCFVSAEYVATLAFRSKSPGLLSSAPSGDSSDPLSPSHNPTGGILWSVAWRKPIRNWSLLAERIRASATDFFQQAKSGVLRRITRQNHRRLD
jgi:hypothetical protein